MINIWKIIKQLENTSGTNDKIKIMVDNSDNEIFRKVLIYANDSEMKFGVSLKVLNKILECKFIGKCKYNDMFMLLDVLAANNINDEFRRQINLFYYNLGSEEEKELFKRVILKDLQCKVSKKSINKAIPNLLVDFSPMKADSYDDKMDSFNKKAEKEGYMIMIKKNGIRGEVFVENGKVVIKSRQNKIIEGLVDLEEEFSHFEDGLYEGEMLANGFFKTSEEQFKATDKIINSKGIKRGIYIDLFDKVSLEGFTLGKENKKAIDRKRELKELVEIMNKPHINYAQPIYEGKDTNVILDKLKEVTEGSKEEGLMVILNNSIYECKKVNHILKVKEFFTMDLMVIGVNEGKKESSKGKMGSIAVDFKGNQVDVSGWTDYEKDYYWKYPEEIIGKVLEVKYKSITKDKDGKESLQFPQKVRIREEGKNISYC